MVDPPTLNRFRVDDYFAKVDYLTKHLGRMWTRFNFFLTIEAAALAGLVFAPSSGRVVLTWVVATAGLVVSVVWWFVGTQDGALVDLYRAEIAEAHDALDLPKGETVRVIGDTGRSSKDLLKVWQAERREKPIWDPLTRPQRSEALSITRLPAALPLLLLPLWFGGLVWTLVDPQVSPF